MVRALLAKTRSGRLNVGESGVTNARVVVVVKSNGLPIKLTAFAWLMLPGMYWEWLKTLNACAMNSKPTLSVKLNRFTRVKSQLLVRGKGIVFRVMLANAPLPATTYRAFGSF